MKVNEWLKPATEQLKKAGIGTARLDALVLLEDATGKDRSWLLAHPETTLQDAALNKLEAQLKRRVLHEPLSYIRGKTEFYGREFIVNKHVLEPRPESETMVELLKNLLHHKVSIYKEAPCIVDVGTGSGALAITAKLEIPGAKVMATDIDPNCLVVAKSNARKLGVKVKFFKGDLLEPLFSIPDSQFPSIILANLPYVPDGYKINQAAAMEPKHAIFGGPDGLDLYRRLFGQLDSLGQKPSFVLTESLPPQHKKLAAIAKKHGYKQTKTADFIQVFKIA